MYQYQYQYEQFLCFYIGHSNFLLFPPQASYKDQRPLQELNWTSKSGCTLQFSLKHYFPYVVYKLFRNGLHCECRGSNILLRQGVLRVLYAYKKKPSSLVVVHVVQRKKISPSFWEFGNFCCGLFGPNYPMCMPTPFELGY